MAHIVFSISAIIIIIADNFHQSSPALLKSIPYNLDGYEVLYREFISVTSEPLEQLTTEKLSIAQSLFSTTNYDNSTAEFFRRFQRIDHYEVPFTTVTFNMENITVVPEILNRISSFYQKYFNEEIPRYPKYPFLILIPPLTEGERSHEHPNPNSITKPEIEKLILDKLEPTAISYFLLDSSIFLAFTGSKIPHQHGPESNQSLDIWEVYSIKNKTFLNHVEEPLTMANGRLLKQSHLMRRHDWEGVEVDCALFNKDVNDKGEIEGVGKYEVDLRKEPNGKLRLGKGLSSSIVKDFEIALNFTKNILQPYNDYTNINSYFDKFDDAFDICVSHHGLNPERLARIHHLAPTYFDGITAYFVQPPVHTFRNIYVTPFAPRMWAMMLVTWIAITFSFKLISHIRTAIHSPGFWKYEVEVREKERDEQVTREAVWWAIAATCQQGWYMTPGTTPSRSVFFTGLLFSFLCYAAYTATIVSELWENIIPIKNLEGLLTNSEEVYLIHGTDVSDLIVEGMEQRDPQMLKKLRTINMEAAINNVINTKPGSSCVLDWPEYFVETAKEVFKKKHKTWGDFSEEHGHRHNPEVELCEQLKSYPYEYLPSKASMFVPKRSPFRKTLNFRILVGIERGLIKRYWKEYLKNTKVRCLEEVNKTYALGIYDTWIVFMILLSGYASSILILLIEITHHKKLLDRVLKKIK